VDFAAGPDRVFKVAKDDDEGLGTDGKAELVLLDCLDIHSENDGDVGVVAGVFFGCEDVERTFVAQGAVLSTYKSSHIW
jgi:hypothetical protein